MIFVLSSINQPLHPRLVPPGPSLDPIPLLGLLAITISACSDKFFVITVLYTIPLAAHLQRNYPHAV
jgi:hypothetical protein